MRVPRVLPVPRPVWLCSLACESRVCCGPRGSLWLQKVRELSYMSEKERESYSVGGLVPGEPAWDVFDREGRYLGVVEIPLSFVSSGESHL